MHSFVLCLLTLTLLCSPGHAETGGRDHHEIARGDDADPGQYPYVVRVLRRVDEDGSLSSCTGTLLAPDWVLTAAHCVGAIEGLPVADTEDLRVFIGHDWEHMRQGNAEDQSGILQVVIHSQWSDIVLGTNDVALLQLEKSFSVEPMRILSAAEEARYAPSGTTAVAVGWGKTERVDSPRFLQHVEVPLLSRDDCNKRLRVFGLRQAVGTFCGGTAAEGIRSGDSGGPLLVPVGSGFGQVGVASLASVDPELVGFPGTYVQISRHYDWIQRHVTGATGEVAAHWVIPTSVNARGRGGGVFKTKVILNSNDPENDIEITATLYGPNGQEGQRTIVLKPLNYAVYWNFLGYVFDYSGGGAVEFTSHRPFDLASVEVYIDTDNGRSTTVVSNRPTPFKPYSGEAISLGVEVSKDQRTNIGVFNNSAHSQTVTAQVWAGDGSEEPVQTITFDLSAKSWSQKSVSAKVDNGFIYWQIPREAYLYVVGVNNQSQDGTLTVPIPLE